MIYTPRQPMIQTTDLCLTYGQVNALSGVSVTLGDADPARGAITGVLGVNGAGKSSFFAALVGAVPHGGTARVTGTVLIGGRPSAQARRAGVVAWMPQHDAVDSDFPLLVRDVVLQGRHPHVRWYQRTSRVDRDIVNNALDDVGLSQLRNRPLGELSGGQRKRVFVARALAQRAPLMILDEPFAGVDMASEQVIHGVLRDFAAQGGDVLVSVHDLEAAARLCDRVLVFGGGRVRADGVPRDVLDPRRVSSLFFPTHRGGVDA